MGCEDDASGGTIPLPGHREYPDDEMAQRAAALLAEMQQRRSVRDFSRRPVPRAVIQNCLRTAGTAPSGANLQPWHFVVVEDPAMKRQIRSASETAERKFYERQAAGQWVKDLSSLGTGPSKPFLEDAPYLIVVFVQRWREDESGKRPNYYPTESVAISVGMLITALHHAGLGVLTYTPSSMVFLGEMLERPDAERPMMILVTGHPAEGATVPDIQRKSLGQIATFLEEGRE